MYRCENPNCQKNVIEKVSYKIILRRKKSAGPNKPIGSIEKVLNVCLSCLEAANLEEPTPLPPNRTQRRRQQHSANVVHTH